MHTETDVPCVSFFDIEQLVMCFPLPHKQPPMQHYIDKIRAQLKNKNCTFPVHMRKACEKHADSNNLKKAKHENLSKPPKQKKIKPTFLKGRDLHFAFKKAKGQTQFSVRPHSDRIKYPSMPPNTRGSSPAPFSRSSSPSTASSVR
jgi:hypothetical protein